ncbi:unnamed protein product [Parascedosporium putredinis]|uniref:Uncharacterized protein n=1 Tax=Parascedosporium putredinis TaxID=1442378 RepID=A0A9P1GYN5_9PEZI|nr:unnamed protein product [Parascedosporium putredinis]CAI7990288.1 unnamed protein product [Parascedosporium putredinis]
MPALPVGPETLNHGFIEVRNIILRRAVDHSILETVAVTFTIFISMGALMYWGIVKGGDCACGGKKR